MIVEVIYCLVVKGFCMSTQEYLYQIYFFHATNVTLQFVLILTKIIQFYSDKTKSIHLGEKKDRCN